MRELSGYLGREFPCSCGRVHKTALKEVEISSGATQKLPSLVRKLGHSRVFLIADENTWEVLGRKAGEILTKEGIPWGKTVLPGEVLADEAGVGQVLLDMAGEWDLLLSVGTGTVNDIGKLVSFRLGLPYFIAATAPSMDGFVSNVAAMTRGRMKTTYPAHVPEAVIADLDVLKNAPMEMISAGLGDILGKYTALADWKVSHLVTGEYLCPEIVSMMEEAIMEAAESAGGLLAREPEAIEKLTKALILSGIAMSFAGVSRPASGSEHHLSHFWEMAFLSQGRKPVLHGTKVGVGTVIILALYQQFARTPFDPEKARRHALHFDKEGWEEAVREGFGPAAQGVLDLEVTARKNAAAGQEKRLARIGETWPELQKIAKELPCPDKAADLLKKLSAPTTPGELGIDQVLTVQAVLLAKEVRDRYTLLQLLWDLGLLEEWAEKAPEEERL